MLQGNTIPELFLQGGPLMWPLLVCALVGLALLGERTLYFARLRFEYDGFVAVVGRHVAAREASAARSLCERVRHPVARLAAVFLSLLDRAPEHRAEVLGREGGHLLEAARARLSELRLVARVAPLLGLLGTATGLAGSFWRIGQAAGPFQPAELAVGMGAALIPTVVGLGIAIPCSAAGHVFQDRVQRVARQLACVVAELEECAASAASGAP